jgi:hypothetical protein
VPWIARRYDKGGEPRRGVSRDSAVACARRLSPLELGGLTARSVPRTSSCMTWWVRDTSNAGQPGLPHRQLARTSWVVPPSSVICGTTSPRSCCYPQAQCTYTSDGAHHRKLSKPGRLVLVHPPWQATVCRPRSRRRSDYPPQIGRHTMVN